ncbi:MAG: hypothetical protein M1378_07965 [Bacteroidetes bacterium]|nr:hypothetical protein [Bacteroidota bacterium]
MNTFERHFEHFQAFIDKILSWSPDYVVPVAKKGCKLLKASSRFAPFDSKLLRYRTYFEINNVSVKGKKIAVVDDATQFTATLKEYRRYFENLGATVRTFSFVGHSSLLEGTRWMYDSAAEIHRYLPDSVYQEYILQQSYYLLENSNHFDLDHLVFEFDLPSLQFELFQSQLRSVGLLLPIEDYFLAGEICRFSLDEQRFFRSMPFLQDPSISPGPIMKIKFSYNKLQQCLSFSPLVFPTWSYPRSSVSRADFQNLPFSVPFALPSEIDKRNRGALMRVYNNILFVYATCFAKAFIQAIRGISAAPTKIELKRNDLDATYGPEITDRLKKSCEQFISIHEPIDFSQPIQEKPPKPLKKRFRDFGQVIHELKTQYELNARRKKTRLGIHYYVTYEDLFRRYADHVALSENLDYYCDFGVIVPETIFNKGKILRGCRTGEPNSELCWERTQVLIPLAIEQIKKEVVTKEPGVPAMLLNKLLANIAYDYPHEIHHEFQALIGEPYIFGTMTRAYHHHRAVNKPSLYEAERISPFYRYNKTTKKFYSVNIPAVMKKTSRLFNEEQEISYSELMTYIRLLLKIYSHYNNVDVLNMLSICREENYFYSHILYNIRSWLSDYGQYLDRLKLNGRMQSLHFAGTQCNSASDKLELLGEADTIFGEIEKRFGADIDFIKAVEKLSKGYFPLKASFHPVRELLTKIVQLQLAVTNLSLMAESPKPQYQAKLRQIDGVELLKEWVKTESNDLSSIYKDRVSSDQVVRKAYSKILSLVDSLPKEEPLLESRLRSEALSRARNKATNYVYTQGCSRIVFLYIDFTGLRNVPEPKEPVVSEYYRIVERNIDNRSGAKMYGGNGGDDAFAVLFTDVLPALECVKDIKREFAGDLVLGVKYDLKFGVSAVAFKSDKKEEEIIKCWGRAKDCCEYKGESFRNMGNLVTEESTIAFLEESSDPSILSEFRVIEGEHLRSPSLEKIYSFNLIEPIL